MLSRSISWINKESRLFVYLTSVYFNNLKFYIFQGWNTSFFYPPPNGRILCTLATVIPITVVKDVSLVSPTRRERRRFSFARTLLPRTSSPSAIFSAVSALARWGTMSFFYFVRPSETPSLHRPSGHSADQPKNNVQVALFHSLRPSICWKYCGGVEKLQNSTISMRRPERKPHTCKYDF